MREIVPELALRDPAAGARWLRDVLGFADGGGGLLRLGDQRLRVVPGEPDGPHGRVDHLALAVPDVALALAEAQARGARLGAPTPDGPLAIAEFWGSGVTYAFLDGPEGAKVELIARNPPAAPRPPGHDHVGISCADLAPMRGFFLSLGCREVADVALDRPGGRVDVSFLAWGRSVLEIYCLPETRADPTLTAGRGFWRLRLDGLTTAATGPEGVEVAPP